MSHINFSLSAETCQTIRAVELNSTFDGQAGQPVSAPLGDRISFPCVTDEVAHQGASFVQLTSAVMAMRYPWMSFQSLYRFIIAVDRSAVIEANAHHLKSLWRNLDDLKSRSSAFAFPTNRGIVVVMPVQVMAYAFAPDSEAERQYGITTIWHELAHVYDLSLHYLADEGLGLTSSASSRLNTREVWHEYFADRHSHWLGFSLSFQLELVERALTEVAVLKSDEKIEELAVRLGSAHGRMVANGSEPCQVSSDVLARLEALGAAGPWKNCARDLDEVLECVIQTGQAPNLLGLEASLNVFKAAVKASL